VGQYFEKQRLIETSDCAQKEEMYKFEMG